MKSDRDDPRNAVAVSPETNCDDDGCMVFLVPIALAAMTALALIARWIA
jgi:hypothetical protein